MSDEASTALRVLALGGEGTTSVTHIFIVYASFSLDQTVLDSTYFLYDDERLLLRATKPKKGKVSQTDVESNEGFLPHWRRRTSLFITAKTRFFALILTAVQRQCRAFA